MPRTKNFQIEKKWTFLDDNKPSFSSNRLSPELTSILSNRGIKSEKEAIEFLDPKYESLADPFGLVDMDEACEAILAAIEKKQKITVYGDYDVDGITSTVLLVRFFQEIGIDIDYYVPSRQDEGYGLNKPAIEEIAGRGTGLLITVDCGSTSVDEVDYANKLGLKVVVTDHHAVKDKLPEAVAVVNPKRKEGDFKQELAGVGVVFYLIRALQTKLSHKLPEGREKWFLDLVALGTICDVVPLIKDNRILVKFGLVVLSKSKLPGIKALADVANFDLKTVDSYKVGFLLGPRLNAAGRIEHAESAIKLMLAENYDEAKELAAGLNELNLKRQELTERIVAEAKEKIAGLSKEQKIYLLSDENWPSGVVGIVASRLVEEYSRPVLVMEESVDGLKGSARSISGFNIVEALTKCSDYLDHFGGHAYAAGFSLKKEHFILLENKLIEITEKEIREVDLCPEIIIDKRVLNKNVEQKLMEEVKKMEPFGSANFPPVFASLSNEVIESRLVGSPGIHLKLTAKDETGYIKGIAFNYGENELPESGSVDLAFYLEENTWNGRTNIEGRFIDIKLNK